MKWQSRSQYLWLFLGGLINAKKSSDWEMLGGWKMYVMDVLTVARYN